ncbi:MAG: hypothetical protein AMQ22_02298 [Candidatus Methanofastidiosum methylothiophilum]|uniref:Uncharacterized protein n=1 Tax=Candidatus Methanofastidiosum methylothiophilum TaxID=1705564 RepID=A0A150IHM8_9EURY|nr:MAG: hypothetical protein AMQ22_02298 [Candidatus Methanofastidiosum methylthiophilus]
MLRCFNKSHFERAAPSLMFSGSPIRYTVTLFSLDKYLAHTNPSPPLLPRPQKTAILFLVPNLFSISDAIPLPAFSIRIDVSRP